MKQPKFLSKLLDYIAFAIFSGVLIVLTVTFGLAIYEIRYQLLRYVAGLLGIAIIIWAAFRVSNKFEEDPNVNDAIIRRILGKDRK